MYEPPPAPLPDPTMTGPAGRPSAVYAALLLAAARLRFNVLLCSALLQQRPRFASLQCLFHSEKNALRLWTANEATTIDKEVQGLNNIFDAEKLEKNTRVGIGKAKH